MKITFSTAQLQAMLAKAFKGAGNNKTDTKTTLVVIETVGGKARFTTNDDGRYLMLTCDTEADGFYVAVDVDILTKLVMKMTSDTTTLEVIDNYLSVVGNGRYQIALEVDEDTGELAHLSNPIDKFVKGEPVGKVNASVISAVVSCLKPALLTQGNDEHWYESYYINNDKILASDTYTVSSYDKGFLNSAMLINSDTMDLVSFLTGEIAVYSDGKYLLFEAENGSVYSWRMDGIEHYDAEGLLSHVAQDFKYSCKISKNIVLNLLDRIALFVSPYDNGEITLSFDADGLEVLSKTAHEKIKYAEPSDKIGEFVCRTDIDTFFTQLKAQMSGVVEVQYGSDSCIKFIDGDIVTVIALME